MINTLLSAAHLRREIGEGPFNALVSSDNTEVVRRFAEKLAGIIPTEITVGGITYEVLPVLREGDGERVKGDVMIARAVETNANLGEKDVQNLLDNWQDIPVALRGKISFVFPNWRRPGSPEYVAVVRWRGERWIRIWGWLGSGFGSNYRVLRLK